MKLIFSTFRRLRCVALYQIYTHQEDSNNLRLFENNTLPTEVRKKYETSAWT